LSQNIDEDNTEFAADAAPRRLSKRSRTDEGLKDALPAPEDAYDFKINSVSWSFQSEHTQ
jgi:hypothetical protein